MHLCGSLRLQGLAPPLCVVLGRLHPTHCFKGPRALAARAGCSRVLARPAACLAAPAALAVSDVLPPRRAPLPVTPLLAIAHGQCSAYCPLRIQRFSFGSGPLAIGLDNAAALPPFAAFPRLFSLIAAPTSVHASVSLGCNVEKNKTSARRKANVSQVLSGLLQAELQVALRRRYCRSILQWAFAQSIRHRVGTQRC